MTFEDAERWHQHTDSNTGSTYMCTLYTAEVDGKTALRCHYNPHSVQMLSKLKYFKQLYLCFT